MRHSLAVQAKAQWQDNGRLVRRLCEAFQLALVLLLFNILAWLFFIAQVLGASRGVWFACYLAPSSVPLDTWPARTCDTALAVGIWSSLQEWKRQRKDAPMTDAQRSRVTTGVGVLLIGLGLLFLAQQVFGFSWSGAWPFFIITVGLVFFAGVVVGGRAAGPLAIPGAVITTVGLILLYQSTFDQYQTWAYAWTLLIVASGVGLLIDAAWRNRPER